MDARRTEEEPELDAAARTAAQLAPPQTALQAMPQAPVTPDTLTPKPAPLDPTQVVQILEAAAFWGDGHKGLARLRFGHRARGGLAGATVTLRQDGDALVVAIDGADPQTEQAVRERLAARGLLVED